MDYYPVKWLTHQHRDAFWKHGSISENYGAIECAVYAVTGWFDAYRRTVPRMLANLKCPRKGLIGAWDHAYPNTGDPGPAIDWLAESLRWWDHWLKDIDTGIMAEPMYRVWMQQEPVMRGFTILPAGGRPRKPGRRPGSPRANSISPKTAWRAMLVMKRRAFSSLCRRSE